MSRRERPRIEFAPHTWPRLDGPAPAAGPEFVPVAVHLAMDRGPAVASVGKADAAGGGSHQPTQILAHAHAQAEAIRRQVREEEAERARQLAAEALRESIAEQVEAFRCAAEGLLEQLRGEHERRIEQIEESCLTLVTAMAEKVIGQRLAEDPAIVLEVVRAALREAGDASQVTVRVSPQDEPLVLEAQGELAAALGGMAGLRVVADESVAPGGCMLDTERGRFDARIQTQLGLLGEQVEQMLKAG
ncbi:MAG TPA: FliH/SctL family protein [Armatimonadota bacterium]|nr:FliH/SctL family protein [Armatimonadota bacterium]